MKYEFNHDAEQMPETLGIAQPRFDELSDAAKETAVKAIMTDKAISNSGLALERLINEGQPKTMVEALILGYMYGKNETKLKSIAEAMAKIAERL